MNFRYVLATFALLVSAASQANAACTIGFDVLLARVVCSPQAPFVEQSATNLTTVGAIPYVSASGVLNQDSPGICWDAVNNRLGLGTCSPAAALHIATGSVHLGGNSIYALADHFSLGATHFSNSAQQVPQVRIDGGGTTFQQIFGGNTFTLRPGDVNSGVLLFNNAANIKIQPAVNLAVLSGNMLIGTETDGNFKVDVQNSGSAGTFRAWDQTATTGTTKAVVRAGAGQGSNNLMEWQNAATGALVAKLNISGGAGGGEFGVLDGYNNFSGIIDGGGGNRILSIFSTGGTQVVRIGGSPGSANFIQSALLIGTATDNNFKLDIANSGSAGTFRAYDQTGTTKAVVRAGAGQTGNLMEWQNSAGSILFGITATGITQWTSIAEPVCNATNRGSVTMVQGGAGVADTYRICRKDAADAYAWTALY